MIKTTNSIFSQQDQLIEKFMTQKGQSFVNSAMGIYELNKIKEIASYAQPIAGSTLQTEEVQSSLGELIDSIESRLLIGFSKEDRAEIDDMANTLATL